MCVTSSLGPEKELSPRSSIFLLSFFSLLNAKGPNRGLRDLTRCPPSHKVMEPRPQNDHVKKITPLPPDPQMYFDINEKQASVLILQIWGLFVIAVSLLLSHFSHV